MEREWNGCKQLFWAFIAKVMHYSNEAVRMIIKEIPRRQPWHVLFP
jgi:hypothetical protein